jgi:hypothetical protein
MKIEIVVWRDAGSDDTGWEQPEETKDIDHIITSIGYVVKETDNYLTLAMDVHTDGSTNGRGRIPKGMVVSREVLR